MPARWQGGTEPSLAASGGPPSPESDSAHPSSPAAARAARGAMSTVLFVCLHNAGRSQMSQALFERAANGRHNALSAGTSPGDRVHPEVVDVMPELGIYLTERRPQLLTRELAQQAYTVVTLGSC